ncbi:ClC family H(+)/Cl(-) exchange transporter [Jeotgalibaca sp. A127]|uniref:ClC family H(+)/Cl(-) exchange transporter n=1 Tax=Jeotgalibaca sp. A127 TaxID=3457324 RepID=UPI003FD03300
MKEKRLDFKVGLLSILSGLLVGVVVSAFRLMIPILTGLVNDLILFGQESWLHTLLFILIFSLIGLVVSWNVKKEPMIGGSGIPQVAGKLSGKLDFAWNSILVHKLMGGILTIGSGLTVGREGPSVQIGAAIGQGVAEKNNLSVPNQKYLIVGAAGAGMAAAFNSPVSGIIFALEELLKKTSRRGFLSSSLTIITATLVSVALLGSKFTLSIPISLELPGKDYPYLVLLGVIIGLSGVFFNKVILTGKHLYAKWSVSTTIKCIFPFFVTALFLLWDPRLLGSGEHFILMPFEGNATFATLVIFYFVKLFLLVVAFASGLPGGIFFPLLALGSLAGNIVGTGLLMGGMIDQNTLLVFTVIAMAAHFAAIVRAPLTGIFLILEMTGGSINYLLPVALVTFIAYFIAELCQSDPIYESLLELMLAGKTNEREWEKGV